MEENDAGEENWFNRAKSIVHIHTTDAYIYIYPVSRYPVWARSRCSGGDKTARQGENEKERTRVEKVEKKRSGRGDPSPAKVKASVAEIKVAEGSGRCLEAASFPIPFVHRMVNGNGRWETRLSMRNAGEFTWRDRNDGPCNGRWRERRYRGVGRGAEINCGFSPRDVSSSARIYHSFTGLLHLFANITAIMYATRANVK